MRSTRFHARHLVRPLATAAAAAVAVGGLGLASAAGPAAAAVAKPSAANTGPAAGVALKSSGSIKVTKAGTVLSNLKVAGNITIAANNVTVRNVHITYSGTSFAIYTTPGHTGTVVDHVEIAMGVSKKGSSAGVAGGTGTKVRYSDIHGTGDGIKAENNSVYEYNYIHVEKPAGSPVHLDGIQGSGDSNWTVRNNNIDVPISKGGNFAVFVQSFTGSREKPVSGVLIADNWLNGGNYTVYIEDGKTGSGYVKGTTYRGNKFGKGQYRYGIKHLEGTYTWSGNTWATGGAC